MSCTCLVLVQRRLSAASVSFSPSIKVLSSTWRIRPSPAGRPPVSCVLPGRDPLAGRPATSFRPCSQRLRFATNGERSGIHLGLISPE